MRTRKEIESGIAEIFRNMRKKRSLSKLKMADLLYLDDKTWARYEDGKTCPSVSEYMWICEQLGENSLRPILNLVYPDTYKHITTDSSIEELRKAAAHYFLHVASDKTVREWDFLTFGHHGSNIEPQMQEFCAIAHLPMEYRVLIARLVKSCWDIAVARNELVCPENIMPDIDILNDGIKQGHNAAIARINSYTTIMKED